MNSNSNPNFSFGFSAFEGWLRFWNFSFIFELELGNYSVHVCRAQYLQHRVPTYQFFFPWQRMELRTTQWSVGCRSTGHTNMRVEHTTENCVRIEWVTSKDDRSNLVHIDQVPLSSFQIDSSMIVQFRENLDRGEHESLQMFSYCWTEESLICGTTLHHRRMCRCKLRRIVNRDSYIWMYEPRKYIGQSLSSRFDMEKYPDECQYLFVGRCHIEHF